MKKEEIEAAASSEPPAVEVRKAKLRQLLAQLKRADLEKREGGQHEEPLRRLDAKNEQRQPEPQQPPEASHLSERRDLSSSRRARGASSGGGGRPRRRSPSVGDAAAAARVLLGATGPAGSRRPPQEAGSGAVGACERATKRGGDSAAAESRWNALPSERDAQVRQLASVSSTIGDRGSKVSGVFGPWLGRFWALRWAMGGSALGQDGAELLLRVGVSAIPASVFADSVSS